jgi:ribosome maturation factor RimP
VGEEVVMSGSSRHGSVRPASTAGSRGTTGSKASSGGGSRGGSGSSRPSRPALPPVDAEKITAVLDEVVRASDMDLEGVRITAAGRRRLLRIVVDADGGVSLDDIARVSRNISAALDDSPVMGELPYTLEVSSPGVDRPLTERRHWRRNIGRLVTVPLTGSAGAGPAEDEVPATVAGRITGASADAITLEVDGQSCQFGYGDLGPGKIKIEFAPIDAGADDEDPDDEGADEEASGSDGY